MEIKKREFDRKEYMTKYFNNDQSLEKELGGIPIRAEVDTEKVIQEYLSVLEFEYYIDVWDCNPRFAKRIYKENNLKTEIIELKTEDAKDLFEILVKEREVIINMSGHYYIETQKQKNILDLILEIEGLRRLPSLLCLNCFTSITKTTLATCEKCGWRNEIDTDPVVNPIVLKKVIYSDYSVQICYPLLDKKLLEYLPEKLRNAVETYFKEPDKLTNEQYQNIYHNIYNRDLKKLNSKKGVLDTRIKFVQFFKVTNFLKFDSAKENKESDQKMVKILDMDGSQLWDIYVGSQTVEEFMAVSPNQTIEEAVNEYISRENFVNLNSPLEDETDEEIEHIRTELIDYIKKML